MKLREGKGKTTGGKGKLREEDGETTGGKG